MEDRKDEGRDTGTLQTALCPETIWLKSQEVTEVWSGSLTQIVFPLQPVAKAQLAPLLTLTITTYPTSKLILRMAFETCPSQRSPKEFMEAQTKLFLESQPLLLLSQLLRVDGFCVCPTPVIAMATDEIMSPPWHIVFVEVPIFSFAHLASHWLQRGQSLARTRSTKRDKQITFMSNDYQSICDMCKKKERVQKYRISTRMNEQREIYQCLNREQSSQWAFFVIRLQNSSSETTESKSRSALSIIS